MPGADLIPGYFRLEKRMCVIRGFLLSADTVLQCFLCLLRSIFSSLSLWVPALFPLVHWVYPIIMIILMIIIITATIISVSFGSFLCFSRSFQNMELAYQAEIDQLGGNWRWSPLEGSLAGMLFPRPCNSSTPILECGHFNSMFNQTGPAVSR